MSFTRIVSGAMVLLAVYGGPSRLLAQPAQSAATPDPDVPTAAVVLDGIELFRVRGVSSYPAAARAGLIEDRIVEAAADPRVAPASLRVVEGPGALRIMAGDHLVMGVVDADAAIEDVSRLDLASAHMIAVRDAIAEYREARSPAARYRSILKTVVSTGAFALAIGLLIWFWRRLDDVLRRRVQARIHTIGIQSFELMRADRIRAALENLLFALRLVVYFACAALYLGYVLAAWPSTRGVSRGIAGLAVDPLRTLGSGLIGNIPRLVFLAVVFLVVRLGLRLLRMFFTAVEHGSVKLNAFEPEWAQPTYKIVRLGVIAFGLIVAYPYIPGSDSEAFKGISLFIGIVFSLGSSSAIANIIAGYMMTYRRAFKVGDRVKIGESVGDVIEMRLQVTHLRTVKNEEVVIPNSQILNGEVLNYSSLARERGLLLHTEVGIGYETPWRQVEAMLLAAAARTPGIGSKPAAFVLVKRLGDFAVFYEINVPCAEVQTMHLVYTALHHNVLDVFNEHGVQIMTPAYEGDPPEPKVVPPGDWVRPPAVAEAATVR